MQAGGGGILHLYSLALSRTDFDGAPIFPPQRNDHSFHIRHFRSEDDGRTWSDQGMVIQPGGAADGADACNVWSGSVLQDRTGQTLFGYTGIRDISPDRPFLQTICVGTGVAPGVMTEAPAAAISCPLRDYDQIKALGFYLGPKARLGDRAGEEGGPIMAWRDPFLVRDRNGELNAFWSAKLGPAIPAIARARLAEGPAGIAIAELLPPIELPDATEYTQSEVPKIYFDKASGLWLLLVAACDRAFEGQPDSKVNFQQRLYTSPTLDGSWASALVSGSRLTGVDYVFGASLIDHDLVTGMLSVFGPFTEQAGPEHQLSFPVVRTLDVKSELNSAS
jgi:hypothetical protein